MYCDDSSIEELMVDVSASSGFKDDHSPNTIDELMYALDTLEGHANESIKASRATEIYWLQTLEERDDLILSKTKYIEDLQRINGQLSQENEMLRKTITSSEKTQADGSVTEKDKALTTTEHYGEIYENNETIAILKDQVFLLLQRLDQTSKDYDEIFKGYQQQRNQKEKEIHRIIKNIRSDYGTSDDSQPLMEQLDELCRLYEHLINDVIEEGGRYTRNFIENNNGLNSRLEIPPAQSSPRKSRPASTSGTDIYYVDMLQTLEKSNRELRTELEQLQRDLTTKEQGLFNETLSRIENSSKDQVEKLKSQIVGLSQELTMMNVDNRALREKLLKIENEREDLHKQLCDSKTTDKEMMSLQINLDSQLGMNQMLKSKIKQLELIKMEHESVCQRIREELEMSHKKVVDYEKQVLGLTAKLKEAKDLQLKFDYLNLQLNNKLSKLQSENTNLINGLTKAEKDLELSSKIVKEENSKVNEVATAIQKLEETKTQQELLISDLSLKLEAAEKQKQNANQKVKALRERLKTMQDSWQKISTDTDSSFGALKDQYKQQTKEYTSIIDSLRSQNSALSAQIESMKKVADQMSSNHNNQIQSLEQQVADYQKITEGYREENILLRKELNSFIQSGHQEKSTKEKERKEANEFAKLKDILTTAKSEVENLQINQTAVPKSAAENDSFMAEREKTKKIVDDIVAKYELDSSPKSKDMDVKYKQFEISDKPWTRYKSLKNELMNKRPCKPEKLPGTGFGAPQGKPVLDGKKDSENDVTKPSFTKPPTIEPFKFSIKASINVNNILPSTSTPMKAFRFPDKQAGLDTPKSSKDEIKIEKFTASSLEELSARSRPVSSADKSNSSRTKEVVQLQHKNSAELDLSKAFKPIEPDCGRENANTAAEANHTFNNKHLSSTYQVNSLPSHLYLKYGSYSKSPISDVYARKPSSAQPNSSIDSGYGSPSKSYSSFHLPSEVNYTSSFVKRPLPSISTYKSSTNISGTSYRDSLSKVLPLPTSKPAHFLTA